MPMKKISFLNLVGFFFLAESLLAAEVFVAPDGAHVPPFRSFETAATNLQASVDAARPGDLIRVAPGVYKQGAQAVHPGAVPNRLVLDRAVTMRSESGPAVTVIDGSEQMRCACMSGESRLVGFTLRNGKTGHGEPGAGVWAMDDAQLENCIISNCVSGAAGGALYGGIAARCQLMENQAQEGGAAAESQLQSCLLVNNFAVSVGGAASGCSLDFCTVVDNHALRSGGGAYHCHISNSIVYYNRCSGPGRNYFFGTMAMSCTRPCPAWADGKGIITKRPRFLDRPNGVFDLTLMSPCIDQAGPANGMLDLTGKPRALDGDHDGVSRADIGALEYVHPSADSDGNGVTDYTQFNTETR